MAKLKFPLIFRFKGRSCCKTAPTYHVTSHCKTERSGAWARQLAMTARAYNVPVILPDLRKEESYHQIVDALEYLDAVANDVFNRITCR